MSDFLCQIWDLTSDTLTGCLRGGLKIRGRVTKSKIRLFSNDVQRFFHKVLGFACSLW